ncbi:hypothetical protein K438DRAFT_1845026 [Mycena galopus ATCC 62051]|nr:hypothetical protein K438DRAFT_1845026 [Mycena galopus ATCC 62051]
MVCSRRAFFLVLSILNSLPLCVLQVREAVILPSTRLNPSHSRFHSNATDVEGREECHAGENGEEEDTNDAYVRFFSLWNQAFNDSPPTSERAAHCQLPPPRIPRLRDYMPRRVSRSSHYPPMSRSLRALATIPRFAAGRA